MPPQPSTFAAELIGGVMLVLGAYTRAVALALVPVLLGATWAHLGNGWTFSAPKGGWEYPAFLTLAAVVVGLPATAATRSPRASAEPRASAGSSNAPRDRLRPTHAGRRAAAFDPPGRAMKRQPTLFLSHGSPMHPVEPGGAGKAWEALGAALPPPRAVLVASAHWETSVPMLTGNPQPETIHDFGGFPAELYTLRYLAPGATR